MKGKIIAFIIFITLCLSGFLAIGIMEKNVVMDGKEIREYKGEIKEIRDTINFSPPVIEDEGECVVIEIEGTASFTTKPGEPMLPVYTKILTFPLGTKIREVECSVLGEEEMKIEKDVVPSPQPLPINGDIEKVNSHLHQKSSLFPHAWYAYKTSGGLHDNEHVTFLVIHIYPVRYIPDRQVLRYIKEAEIKVTYEEHSSLSLSTDIYELLIVAPSEFSDALISLVSHKENYDVSTKLVTLDEIYGGAYFPENGRDDAERIKYFIKDAVEQWGIKYVLFVGDIAHVPSREVLSFAWGDNKMFSDHYYADLYDANMSFCSWDSNRNNLFGEAYDENDFVDLYTDVHVGRLVCKDVEEVSTVVNKIVMYESTTYGKEWFDELIVMGGDTFPRWGCDRGRSGK